MKDESCIILFQPGFEVEVPGPWPPCSASHGNGRLSQSDRINTPNTTKKFKTKLIVESEILVGLVVPKRSIL